MRIGVRRWTAFLSMFCCAAVLADDAVTQRLAEQNALIAEHWEYRLREFPELATARGDPRHADRWTDYSLAHVPEQRREVAAQRDRLRTIDTGGFAEADRLNHILLARELDEWLQSLDLKTYLLPLDHFNGVHLQLTQMATLAPLASTPQIEAYIERLRKIPALLDDVSAVLLEAREHKLMPPRHVLDKVAEQCRAIADARAADSVFAQRLAKRPETIDDAEHQRLRDTALDVLGSQVLPAYRRFGEFVARELAPAGRRHAGIWSLPDGAARYRFAIRQQTTLALDPEAIHRLGIAEVERIEAEQAVIARRLGYADLPALRDAVRNERRFYASSREQILERYRTHSAAMTAKLPRLFGRVPNAALEIVPVEAFREKTAGAASYSWGTPDGTRPGRVFVNTGEPDKRSWLPIEAIAYHEGVPGHHLQISIAQALPDLPAFRRSANYGAYVEGWGLYAERLAKEVGQYQDPLSDYGRLSNELLRAIRLVVDTGLHHKRWTREQVVAYLRAHSSEDEPTVQAETDRYIVWPAQALAYKLGELKLLELRDRARRALGRRFDLRVFHDMVLGSGALPLDVLDARTEAWIEQQTKRR